MKINCDLGELADWQQCHQQNDCLMPFIDLANIACGGHAGDEQTMNVCVRQCLHHKVAIGAHPAYLDRENFGRESQIYQSVELYKILYQQIATLQTLCRQQGTQLHHIKAHGALYHDSDHNFTIFSTLCRLALAFDTVLVVSHNCPFVEGSSVLVGDVLLAIYREAFADRQYQLDGTLLSRKKPKSVHTLSHVISQQYSYLLKKKCVWIDQQRISIDADTICFHSDNPASVQALQNLTASHLSSKKN